MTKMIALIIIIMILIAKRQKTSPFISNFPTLIKSEIVAKTESLMQFILPLWFISDI